jgi:hypothetical protein
MTGIDQRSQLGTGFAPETRMNAGIGVPTIPVATALRQRNKVRAALAGFSLGSRRRRSADRSCLRKSVTSTQTERWQPHRRRPAHHTKHQPTPSPATFTDLEPELGDIVKQLIDFVADSKMGLPQLIAGRFMAPVRRTSPGGLPVVRL